LKLKAEWDASTFSSHMQFISILGLSVGSGGRRAILNCMKWRGRRVLVYRTEGRRACLLIVAVVSGLSLHHSAPQV